MKKQKVKKLTARQANNPSLKRKQHEVLQENLGALHAKIDDQGFVTSYKKLDYFASGSSEVACNIYKTKK